MNWSEMRQFFNENRELLFFLGSVAVAIFAEGGRRTYRRRRAAKQVCPTNQGEKNGKGI